MKEELKKKAIVLRTRGRSIKEISDILDVSKSTASLWVRNVILSKKSKQRIFKISEVGRKKGALTNIRKRQLVIKNIERNISLEFSKIILSIESKKVLCAMIYYCEGVKNDNIVCFTNSDPLLLVYFLDLFKQSFNLKESKFRVVVHIHQYHNWEKQKKYWSKTLNIEDKYFNKPFLKENTGKNKRKGYQGCVSLRYYDSNIAKEILAIAKLFLNKKNAGFV